MRKYALGHAFTLKNLFDNFSLKLLKISCNECQKITGDRHRDILAKRIFIESLKLVLDDIIDNNVTFWLPLTSNKKCNIHMKRFQGKAFSDLRKAGKWKDIDILKSMFTGYQMSLFMLGNRTPRVKPIYLNKYFRDKIVYNTNNGMQYGDSNNDKTIKDYYQILYSMFPSVPESDIRKILSFSWKSLYLHNSYGGDVIIKSLDIWCYIGEIKRDSLQHFFYYIRKLTIKLRILYRRKKIEWNGYYYFALSDSQYEQYLKQKKKRGRPRKYFNFGSVYLYQIFDECKINEYYKKYIFRIPYISRLNTKYFVKELITDKAELIITRESLKFKDILVHDNEYEYL